MEEKDIAIWTMNMRFFFPTAFLAWWASGYAHPPPFTEAACTNLRGAKWFAEPSMWSSHHQRLYYASQPFELKGMNWHGMESSCLLVHGLWENTLGFYLDLLKDQNFNALRIPLSFELMENLHLPVNPSCATAEPAITPGMTVGDFLHWFLEETLVRKIFVLFDLHTIGETITELPWTAEISEDRIVNAWVNFAQSYGKHPAVMGFEIKNEPHGPISSAEFHTHCAKVIQAIQKHFAGLYFIDGTSFSTVDHPPWGGSFESISQNCQDDALCQLNIPSRLVFAPHVYGPDVRGNEVSTEDDTVFERRFGFLAQHAFFNTSAIIVTEFGGTIQNEDYTYFMKWKDFCVKHNLSTGAFFWTLPPSSADTGGILLDDYRTVNKQKLDFLKNLQPSPSHPC